MLSRTVVVCVGITGLLHLVTYLLNTQLPLQIIARGGSHAEIGWLFAVTTGVAMLLRPQVGGWTDRIGARSVLLPGALVLVATMLALNAVTSSAGFIALMAGLGIANALISTSGSIVVAADSPPIRRGEALSLYYVASSTGVALGPVVGFTLADIGGLRLNLIVATTLAVVLAALVLTLPPSRTRSPATAVVGRLWSAHAVAASLTLVVITTGQATVYAFLPLYAAATGIGRIAWFFPLMSGCTIVCRLLLRRASDTFGRAPVLMPAITAVALGNALLAVPPSVGTLVLSAALLGSGNSMLYPTLVALVVDRAPERERGLAIGTVSGAWDVGVALGSPVIAFLVHGFGYGVGFLASAVAAALGLLVFALTERRRRRRTLSALAAAD